MKSTPKLKLIADMILTDKNPRGLSPEDIISKAKAKLIGRHPFWGILVAPIRIYFDNERGKTAWTDGESIGFNFEFFCKLTFEEFLFVVAHEVWHMANLHIPRLGARHPKLWNVATDHFINLTLGDEATLHPHLFAVPDFPRIFENPKSGLCMDERFKDWAADAIYAQLMREQSQDEQSGGDGDEEEEGLGGDLDYEAYGGNDTETQEEKAKRLERMWKNQMAAAANAGKKAGNLPGSLARWVHELLQPRVDWQTVLAAYISQTLADYEWTQPDRRFSDWDFVVPDMVGERLVAVPVIDTSGSISEEMIREFISEVYAIIRSFDKVDGVLVGHDHEVHDVIEFSNDEPPEGFTGGGGGTNFHCVTRELKERDIKPNIMIWFTDLYSEMIPQPDYPVIFVAVDTPLTGPDWAITIPLTTR